MNSGDIKKKAIESGYLNCGIIPAAVFGEYSRSLDERIKLFPQSKELYEKMYGMAVPDGNAKSIIVCTQKYTQYRAPESLYGLIGKFYLFDGRVSYNSECRAKNEFETFLKLAGMKILQCGIPVRWAAARAGIGKFGRNNFIYDRVHGSYIWIEAWAVCNELEYDPVCEDVYLPACNDSCQKCIKACPTKALSGKLSMDMGKCITRLVCSSNDLPAEDLRPAMGGWIYGCDVCQDACPHNKNRFDKSQEYPLLADFAEYLKPENILEMDDYTYQNIVNPRFWYSGREGIWRWKCNALRNMINSGEKKYHALIIKYADHEDPRIKETAQWGIKHLGLENTVNQS